MIKEKRKNYAGQRCLFICAVLIQIGILSLLSACEEELETEQTEPGPPPPQNIKVSAGNGNLRLTWDTTEDADTYNIYYLTYPGVTPINSKQINEADSGYLITGLINETTYYFVLTSLKSGLEGPASEEISATPMPPVPGIPDNLTIYGGIEQASLFWRWVPDATSYNIYYDTSPGVTKKSPNSIRNIIEYNRTIGGLNQVPVNYYFIVTAENVSGEGEPSVEMVVKSVPGYKSVAAGYGHSAALRIMEDELPVDNGSVWTWGDNSSGQLGTGGSPQEARTAIEATGVNSVLQIAAGWHHTSVLRTDQSVWNWGLNDYGQLGNQETNNKNLADQSYGLEDIVSIAASEKHGVALKYDGTVWAWGFNQQGQLGYPSINCQVPFPLDQPLAWSCSFTPSEVSGITGLVTSVAAGFYHTMATTNDGLVWAWGQADSGQLGALPPNCPPELQLPDDIGAYNDPAYACSTIPLPVADLPGFVTTVSGGWGHSLAIMDDGTVWAWGKNDYGQLGYDPDALDVHNLTCQQTTAFVFPCRVRPVMVEGLSHIIAISSGWDHNLALKNDGTVWVWGRNSEGQLGLGAKDLVRHFTVEQVPGLTGVISIAAGAYHSIALKNDGTAWAWGYNGHSQLGNGNKTDSASPVQVQGLKYPVVILTGL
ncbi:MAG: hypothetical protein OEZ59_11620 [Deltaproteobacteria bacterium]|nr:hypothetical protein [Deltaproteobacteria bacterium]